MDPLIGEIAALASAVAYSTTSVFFTFAGRKISAVACMAMSLPISWLAIIVLHRLVMGVFFPVDVPLERWVFLGGSGIMAFGVSSYFLLSAYQYIGPRLTMLISAFSPVFGSLLAWLFLGQTLALSSSVGIAIVLFGIVWVVAERRGANGGYHEPDLRRGLIYACLATATQALAFVFASRGVEGDFPPFTASLIRVTVGIVGLWAFVGFRGNLRSTALAYRHDRKLFLLLVGAALAGPVAAGSLLLFALQTVPVGIATTLSNTTSIMLIPIAYFIFKERITMRAIAGTVVTIVGIAILFT